LEKLRAQRDEAEGLTRKSNHAEMLAREEDDRQVRLSLWHELLASPQAQPLNEFEAVTYISSKCGETVSARSDSSLQCFNAEYAVRFGVEEAAVISLFQDWIGFNRAMGHNSSDGRTYTGGTVDGFASRARFLNVYRMRDALDGLIGTGVLDKHSISTRTGRMLGYAFQDDGGCLLDW
jgi:hypothetical protein